MTTHIHTQAEYTQERGQPEAPRPQTPCYSQNDDVTTAISISYLETGHLKPARQLLCNMLFGLLPPPLFTPILLNKQNRPKNQQLTNYSVVQQEFRSQYQKRNSLTFGK